MANPLKEEHLLKDLLKKYPFNAQTMTQDIARKQYSFCTKFIPLIGSPDDENAYVHLASKDKLWWVRECAVCLMDEVQEIIGWLPWKHWKKYQEFKFVETKDGLEIDRLAEIKFEVIDILHFAFDMGFCLGVDFSELSIPEFMEAVWTESTLGERAEHASLVLKNAMGTENETGAAKELCDIWKEWANHMYYQISACVAFNQEVTSSQDCWENLMGVMCEGFVIAQMTPEDVYNHYLSKNAENFARQERGY